MGFFSRNRGKGPDAGSGAERADFSQITTVALAQAAAERGELEPMHLFPPKVGGEDSAVNIVYVPVGVNLVKHQLTGTLVRLFQEGTIDKLTVSPEYKGESVVPAKVVLAASHGTKSGSFNPTIDIW